MGLELLLAILAAITVMAMLAIWYISHSHARKTNGASNKLSDLTTAAKGDVEHIFNDDFREELRNRGRLHFEKIISENAMFLQQDLRLTTSQLNEFMKAEITNVLKEEFAKYEESINDAKQLAIESIEKTQDMIEQQRGLMTQQLSEQLKAEKARTLEQFEQHMADVVNHYVLEAVGDQIDLNDQLEFILLQMESNKDAMIRDIRDGA